MFDPEKLKIGDVFYSIKERNLAFHRKKIHQEIDGLDWFRYDRPLRSYELVTYEIFGVLRKELEGRWKPDQADGDLQTEFYVRYQDETHMGHYVMDFYGYTDEHYADKYFVDKEVALEYIKILEAQAKELDKT